MEKYKSFLEKQDLSKNTRYVYFSTVKLYYQKFKELTKRNLIKYKEFLIANYKPQTVNLRLNSMNYYLRYLKNEKWSLKLVKTSHSTFVDNVISVADYEFLKQRLKRSKNYQDYFLIRLLASTGARISEFVNIKIEHIIQGYFDIYGKGNKYRRIYIPLKVRREILKHIKRDSGFLFLTERGTPYKPINVIQRLKYLANKYKIDERVMYPHSFRHRFAKNFIFKYNDICLLADLLGHESIETTRIYLRKTSTEQKDIVDKIIDW